MESRFKLVILGDSNVGKTSLLSKYVLNEFNERQQCTLAASFLLKTVTLPTGTYTLNIWDTVGQERFRSIAPVYYQQANGALIVYDITDTASFRNVDLWINELKKFADPNIAIFLAGNKSDLESQRKVHLKEAVAFAGSVGVEHVQVSAKSGAGLDEVFSKLTQEIVKKIPVEVSRQRNRSYKKIVLERTEDSGKKAKKSCC